MKFKSLVTSFLIALVLGLLAGTILGIVIGVQIAKPDQPVQETEVITTRIVLEKIQDQSFLITRTVISEQETNIVIDRGSAWSNFWWGHEISASGTMQVDIGVDLAKITTEDIEIDTDNQKIYINLPEAEVFDSSLQGEIQVETSSGILKKLLASDDNQDFNLALEQLTQQAQEAVLEDQQLLDEAQESAIYTIQVLLHETEYEVVIMTTSE